jgi:hypothetical protein
MSIAPVGRCSPRFSSSMSSTPSWPSGPVVIGALLEAATHGVIVDAEVEDLREVGQKVVAIAAASTDEQHLWFWAFEFADRLLLVPHPVVVMNGPAWKANVGVGVIGPGAVGTDGVVAASDQLVVHRGLTGPRQALHQVVPFRHDDGPVSGRAASAHMIVAALHVFADAPRYGVPQLDPGSGVLAAR